MGKIIKLDKNISSKIAAGEVIENPSAVIKELVENSIDADAKNIIIEIKDAGKSYIRITDDGHGISKEDTLVAFDRHATSKIRTVEDIYAINTLGFRGEALASIAAVSRLELVTRTKKSELGRKLILHGGEKISDESVGSKVGTTFIVKDLFYNTPARVKFLNKNSTEQRRINELMNCLALSNPKISFKYIVNDTIKFVTPGKGNLKNVILSVYGKNTAKSMLKISNTLENVSIDGYISSLDFTRGNSSLQKFFVNGRYIKSSVIKEAIQTAYKTLIPINKYPICFLNFNLNAESIDVNIHPSKTKIKFTNRGILKEIIYKTIKSKLLTYNQTPKVSLEDKVFKESLNDEINSKKSSNSKENSLLNTIEKKYDMKKESNFKKTNTSNFEKKSFSKKMPFNNKNSEKELNIIDLDTFDIELESSEIESKEEIQRKVLEDETIYDNLQVIGQLFKTYILCEKNNELYVIDQHAAHEKVLYESLMEYYLEGSIDSQLLMMPLTIELGYSELENILNKKHVIKKLGFIVEDFGKDTLLIREVPILFNKPMKKEMVKELFFTLSNELKNPYEATIDLIIQKSCKNAIKAYDDLNLLAIEQLIKLLKKLKSPYTCPHGRPIIISISKKEIEKKFKRT